MQTTENIKLEQQESNPKTGLTFENDCCIMNVSRLYFKSIDVFSFGHQLTHFLNFSNYLFYFFCKICKHNKGIPVTVWTTAKLMLIIVMSHLL